MVHCVCNCLALQKMRDANLVQTFGTHMAWACALTGPSKAKKAHLTCAFLCTLEETCYWLLCTGDVSYALSTSLKISTFLGPNVTRFARCHFRDQKSLDFHGPPLPMALVMDAARIKKIITSRAI
jgi:hypothetical protein